MRRSVVRLLRTWHGDEDGISLVETLVASFVLLVGMVSVLGVVVNSIASSNRTRTTDLATQIANEQLESYRSLRYASLALDTDDYSGPATFDGFEVVTASTCEDADPDLVSCPVHTETITRDGRDFEITRWVLAIDDPSDGVGGADADGNTVDYKRVVIDISWTQPAPGSHRIQTNVTNDQAGTPGPDDGVRFEVRRASDGTLIDETDDYINFPVEVWKASTSYTNESIEGIADVLGIPQDTYFCTVGRASPEWYPAGDPFASEDIQTCVVADGVLTVTSEWVHAPCDPSDSLTNPATVTVEDSDGNAVTGASVTIDREDGGPSYSGTTGGGGDVTWEANYGIYDVEVTHATLGNEDGRLCVSETNGSAVIVYGGSLDDEEDEEDGDDPQTDGCDVVSDKAVWCVEVTNDDDEGRFFRIEFELEDEPDGGGDKKFYEPPRPDGVDDKQHQGIYIEAGETVLIERAVDPAQYKKIKLERADIKKEGERDWKKEAEWKEDDHWDKDDGLLTGETYEWAEVVD